MNDVLLANRLIGRWIVQSANYSLLLHPDSKNLFVNQVEWTNIKNSKLYLESIRGCLNKQGKLSKISVYCVKSTSSQLHSTHYVACVYRGPRLKLLIKLNQDLVFLNQFIVQSQSFNCLTVMSCCNCMVIVEKIYFINRNLKVIKSTIQKSSKYIGTSFSSEIRIS